MTETITILLNKLVAWEGNVRKTEPDKGIDELAASIAAHGLLQPLVVRKDRRGKYAVVAGQRRLLALKSLAATDQIAADMPIPCTVIAADADATEISLVENVQREAMHPADEFDAFKALIDNGMHVADVAARFGVTETVVQKRLKLANVSAALIAAYRDGEMTLQHIMAFAVTDDHALQEHVWNELSDWQKEDPDNIRDILTESEITAQDRRVKFVGLEAYERAGGTARRDLFSDSEQGVFIDDVVLLESLVAKKLEKAASKLRKEGWKWVEIVPAFRPADWAECERRVPEPLPLSPEHQAEFQQLSAEHEELWGMDEPTDEQQSRLDEVSERIDELENRPRIWPAETLAIAGAVVALGSDGKVAIHAGYVKPEDAPPKSRGAPQPDEDGVAPRKATGLSASLIESLTAHRSAALNAALLERPDMAFAATVHALALKVFYNDAGDTVLQIRANAASLHRVEGSRAHATIEAAWLEWGGKIPGNADMLLAWCLGLSQDTLMKLLAFCVARTVNAVLLKADRPDSDRMAHADLLADALQLDMAVWFTPTAANYFSRVSKAAMIEALREIKGAATPRWESMKKNELAALAEREVAGTGWLPEPLRTPAASPEAGD